MNFRNVKSLEDLLKKADNKMLRQYLETALWSSTGDNSEPLDKNHNIEDIAKESIEKASKDCDLFIEKAGSLLDGLDLEDIGHDFWLTRNHHGAGFWDGDYDEEIGKKLTDISHSFGGCDMYVGDDGNIYLS